MTSKNLRENLRQELALARKETDRLFDMLAPEALTQRPISERHRVIFYLGHLEAFDWNMICCKSYGMQPFNAEFDHLFEFGIDPVDGRLPQDKPSDWPHVEEILSYNKRVRGTVDDLLDRANFETASEPYVRNALIFHVAIEHRLMHAETLSYMFHWLDFDLKRSDEAGSPGAETEGLRLLNEAVRIPAGEVQLGQRSSSFGWDNEFETCSVSVPEFRMDLFNVTNGQFLEFVRSGGYQHRPFWSDTDWDWIQGSGIQHPKFWVQRGDSWFYRTMFDEIPLPTSWPVYVSHAEASAYARWKEKSLPTESQYYRAAFGSPEGIEPRVPSGNFDSRSWTPHAVGSAPGSASAFGVYDLVGNGWEWTSTPFAPFEGFEAFPFYPGYSADFFDGKHYVLKGASPRTAASLVRKSFRNWFQPHYPNIYATFRCVR